MVFPPERDPGLSSLKRLNMAQCHGKCISCPSVNKSEVGCTSISVYPGQRGFTGREMCRAKSREASVQQGWVITLINSSNGEVKTL